MYITRKYVAFFYLPIKFTLYLWYFLYNFFDVLVNTSVMIFCNAVFSVVNIYLSRRLFWKAAIKTVGNTAAVKDCTHHMLWFLLSLRCIKWSCNNNNNIKITGRRGARPSEAQRSKRETLPHHLFLRMMGFMLTINHPSTCGIVLSSLSDYNIAYWRLL